MLELHDHAFNSSHNHVPLMGLEPTISSLGGRRLIHWATKADKGYTVLNCSCDIPALPTLSQASWFPYMPSIKISRSTYLVSGYPGPPYIRSIPISRYPVFRPPPTYLVSRYPDIQFFLALVLDTSCSCLRWTIHE